MSGIRDQNGDTSVNPNVVSVFNPITVGTTIITEDNVAIFTEDFDKMITEDNA